MSYLNINSYRVPFETEKPMPTKAQAEKDVLIFGGYRTDRRIVAGVTLEMLWDGQSDFMAEYRFPRTFTHIVTGIGRAKPLEAPISGMRVVSSTKIFDRPPHIEGLHQDDACENSFVFPPTLGGYILSDHMDKHLLEKVKQTIGGEDV